MFEQLDEKFDDQRAEGRKNEMMAKNSYDLLIQELKNLVQRAKEDKEDKTGQKAKRARSLASAEGELADTQRTKAEDKQYLEDLTAECSQKAQEFEERGEMRAQEIEALKKAEDKQYLEDLTAECSQ